MLTINEFKVLIVVLLEIALVRVLAVGEVAVAVALVEDGLQLLPAHVVVVPLQVVHHQPPRAAEFGIFFFSKITSKLQNKGPKKGKIGAP